MRAIIKIQSISDVITNSSSEAFKLKSFLFLNKERSDIDKGQVDIEMTEGYGDAAEQ